MGRKIDLSGKKFNRVTVLKDTGQRTETKKVIYECHCDCGTIFRVRGCNLVSGNTRSCGCLQKEEARARLLTHGKSGTAEYQKNLQLRQYNLTIDSLKSLYEKQNYKCGICGTEEKDLNWSLNIDHNHDTGKVRGLLCANCNVGLGNFKDNIHLLKNAVLYLENFAQII